MSFHAWIQQNHQKTKQNKKKKRPLPRTIAKPSRKPKKTKKNQSSHTLWGAWAGQDESHYRRNTMYYRENHENSTKILDFRDNNSHPGQPRPPQCVRTFGFSGFFGFLNGFAMVLGRGLWFFLFFLVSWWFCYIQTWKGVDCLQHHIYIYI